MSYYGQMGTKHKYIDTSQPLYGLGSEPSAPAAGKILVVTDSAELMSAVPGGTLLQEMENSPVSADLAAAGLVCFGSRSSGSLTALMPAVAAFKDWQAQGKFVVLRKGFKKSCDASAGIMVHAQTAVDPRTFEWSAYAYPVENISSIQGQYYSFVWGLPYGDTDWSKYAPALAKSAPPPKVVTSPPVVDPKTGTVSQAGLPWGAIALVGGVLLAWKFLVGSGSYSSNDDDGDEEFAANLWELPLPPRRNRGPAATSDIPGKILDFVSSFAKGEANDYLEVFQGVMAPWLKALALHGVPRFKATAARGISCEASNERDGQRYACGLPAVAECAACGRKSCLHHAFITWKGDALCWHCASHTVVQMSMNPPQRPEAEGGWRRPNVPPPGGHGVPPQEEKRRQVELEVIRCLQLLGLPRSATAADLEAAFKSYVKRNHPDKVQDQRERELAEQQFKQVSAAYTFLKGMGFGQEARAS